MERPENTTHDGVTSTTQSIETRRRLADLVIGGLLVAFVIGGLAM
jgi:hypothetical protein